MSYNQTDSELERNIDLEYLTIFDSTTTIYKNKKGVLVVDSDGFISYFMT
jgi:hypothetical protein